MRITTRENADLNAGRWRQLAACVAAMLAIANLQYAWTLFTTPLMISLHATLPAVQWAFTFFVFAQTWLAPGYAFLIDRYGPRLIISLAGLLVGASWIGSGLATSLTQLYITYAIGGVGAGVVYSACIGLAMKWFPDRRGLCVGIVAGAFGFGTGLPISWMIDQSGYRSAFIIWGVIQGLVVFIASQFLIMPPTGWMPVGWAKKKAKIQAKVQQSARDYTPLEMLQTAPFYVLYFMMTIVAFRGLMITAQLKPMGIAYGVDKYQVFAGLSALTLAVQLGPGVLNGGARPLWGWISDHLGRYHTMALAFFLEGLSIIALTLLIDRPIWFLVFSSLTFLAWGQIYSLFPAAIADIFGSKHATTNYGIQYTSKGVASILAGPGAAMLMSATGSWMPVLWVAIACDLVAVALALFWLKPLVTRLVNQQVSTPEEEEQRAAALAVEKDSQAATPSVS